MASAWGDSWGTAWADTWGAGVIPPPPTPTPTTIKSLAARPIRWGGGPDLGRPMPVNLFDDSKPVKPAKYLDDLRQEWNDEDLILLLTAVNQ